MYTLYIDESGDPNTQKIRTADTSGATPYMVLGGVMVKDEQKNDIKLKLEDVQKLFQKENLHCTNLNHFQKRYYAKCIADLDVKLFGVISRKSTLGSYNSEIGTEFWRYYHKCLQYLLEIFGSYLISQGIEKDDVSICVEASNSFRLSKFRNYVNSCHFYPLYTQTQSLKKIKTTRITDQKKKDEPLLQLADLLAHSLFQCVDERKSNYGIKETSYIEDMKNRFHCSQSNEVLGFGLKPIHNINDLQLCDKTSGFLCNLAVSEPV